MPIVGGSTAAVGAALFASKLIDERVCLLEPTDWVGGQLTAELLSAPDYAGYELRDNGNNFTLDVRDINHALNNRNPLLSEMLAVLGNGQSMEHDILTINYVFSIFSLFFFFFKIIYVFVLCPSNSKLSPVLSNCAYII